MYFFSSSHSYALYFSTCLIATVSLGSFSVFIGEKIGFFSVVAALVSAIAFFFSAALVHPFLSHGYQEKVDSESLVVFLDLRLVLYASMFILTTASIFRTYSLAFKDNSMASAKVVFYGNLFVFLILLLLTYLQVKSNLSYGFNGENTIALSGVFSMSFLYGRMLNQLIRAENIENSKLYLLLFFFLVGLIWTIFCSYFLFNTSDRFVNKTVMTEIFPFVVYLAGLFGFLVPKKKYFLG